MVHRSITICTNVIFSKKTFVQVLYACTRLCRILCADEGPLNSFVPPEPLNSFARSAGH